MSKKKHKELEIVTEPGVEQAKYLMTILVLSVALVRAVTGESEVTLGKEAGEKVIEFIQESVQKMFPEIAPMIMGMFGLELMQLMPTLKNPEILIRNIVHQFTHPQENVNPSTQPDTK